MTRGCDTDVAVVIATWNRRERLVETLQRLVTLPERPSIVVVDNDSTDGTAAAVTSFGDDVRLVRLNRNLAAAARNVGVGVAATPFVAFCDDDTWWEPGALPRAAAHLRADPRIDVVAGRVLLHPGGRPDPTCLLMDASPLPRSTGLTGTPVLGFLAGASMVRTSTFRSLGGFHPRFGIGAEERLFSLDVWQRGGAIVYAPDVIVRHQPHPRPNGAARQVMQRRNDLWCAWLRYRSRSALEETLRLAVRARREPSARAALIQAVRGLPWVLRERRVLSPDVAELVRLCAGQVGA